MVIPMVLHSIIVLLAFYLFVLFAWWWIKQKRATTIYGYTCFLMFGIMMTHGGALAVYMTLLFVDHTDVSEYVPDWWALRNLFVIVPLWLYIVYATKKILQNHRSEHPKRRSSDFDSDNFDPDRAKRSTDAADTLASLPEQEDVK